MLFKSYQGAFMRAMWKGSISFGLVNIPVKLISASHDKEFSFKMLHKKDMSEIRYAKICKVEDKEVPWNEIVKGYEYKPGEFITMEEEDFKKVNLKKSSSIDIMHFIKEDEIDTIFYMKPYFLEPEKNGANAYNLLLEALKKSKKVGICKFVLHHREHLAVLKPFENAIILNEMRYLDELSRVKDLNIPAKANISTQEMTIAIKLIDHMTAKFNPKEYKDTYSEDLRDMILKKGKGKKISPKGHEAKPSKIVDIMSLLKQSLEEEESLKKSKRHVKQEKPKKRKSA